MAASSGGMNGDADSLCNIPAKVHVFDFKFKSEETSENLNYFLTNELVKHFGNSSYYTEKSTNNCNVNSNPTNDTSNTGISSVRLSHYEVEPVKKKEENELRGVDVHHRILDIYKNKSNVLKTVLNRKYLCILFEDGSVQRAFCHSEETGVSKKSSISGSSTWNQTDPQNFQVASDESYARSVHRGLNNDRLNLLAGRRSYLGRTNSFHLGHHGVLMGRTSGTSILPQPRDFFSLQRVSPTFRTGRYVPPPFSPYDASRPTYDPSRPNRRHIQMGHLLNIPTVNVPTAPRTMVYTTSGDDEMGQSAMALPDVSIDNITIVSLDEATDQSAPGASDFRISNYGFPNISPTNVHSQDNQSQIDVQPGIDSLPSEGNVITDGLISNEFDQNSNQNNAIVSGMLSEHMLNGPGLINDYVSCTTTPPGSSSTDVPNRYLPNPFSGVIPNVVEGAASTLQSDVNKPVDSSSLYTHSPKLNSFSGESSEFTNHVENSTKEVKSSGISWIPELQELKECPDMEMTFTSLHAMESAFLLVDCDGLLWLWPNADKKPSKADFVWNDGRHKITTVGCNLLRATVLFNSMHAVTFYDKSFTYINNGEEPTLIKTLSHEPSMFTEFIGEQIADIQCSNFFTAVQTVTGRVYWWGLTPSSERNSVSLSSNAQSQENSELHIGDMVSLSKQGKNETGALVFNDHLQQFGVVMQQMSEEVVTQNLASNKIAIQLLFVDDTKAEATQKNITEIWDCKDVVYLQEPNSFTGKVISLDGPYAIVQHNDSSEDHEKLKVYFKSSLEKIMHDENNVTKCENSKVGRSRYQKYLHEAPLRVFSDPDYVIAAMHASEIGIAVLVNRLKDDKAFLIFPECANFHYANWFTSAKRDIEKNENIKSENGATVEFESTPSYESNLCIMSKKTQKQVLNRTPVFASSCEEDIYECKEIADEVLQTANDISDLECALCNHEQNHKFTRSASLPAGINSHRMGTKRKWSDSLYPDEKSNFFCKPTLISISNYQNYFTILLDNIGCLYPIRFGSCLSNPPLLEILPFQSFMLFDRGNGQNKDERLLTVVAVPKVSPLLTSIRSGDKTTVDRLLSTKIKNPSAAKKVKSENTKNVIASDENLNVMMNECCNGNQNIMHVAANNILKIPTQGPIHGNIMEIRNEEENAILHMLLDNINIWPHVKKLLCERDSHGATPFMSALLMQNLRGAYLILVAIKQDGKSVKSSTPKDKELFQKAICTPTFSGLSPLHALIHSSSKKPSSQQWFNTLKVSNLPPNYSARLLLKLFKSRYPSVYRAVMPIPKPLWPQQNVRNKVKGETRPVYEGTSKRGKSKLQPAPQLRASLYRNTITPTSGLSVSGRQFTNRADAIRANAKEGLIMFGNIDEMFQALLEMNNHSLLTKADHPSGALLSVVQHLLQVQQYQEIYQKASSEEAAPPVKPLYGAPLLYNEFGVESSSTGATTSKAGNSQDESLTNREDTISKCFDDIMVHLLLTSLVTADPNIAAIGNSEGETALSYFMKTYPRFSPSHLHKLFLNWRPCNLTNCKYNRHVGKLSVTCLSEVETQPLNNNDKKKATKNETKKNVSVADAPGSSMHLDNPLLYRRGLQAKGNSLMLNVKDNLSGGLDAGCSPITPSIRLLDDLKFAPIEINTSTGLTPQMLPSNSVAESTKQNSIPTSRRGGFNPYFPPISSENELRNGHTDGQSTQEDSSSSQFCSCHLNKARLLWNTTFEASTFFLAKNWPCVAATLISPTCYPKVSDISKLTLVESNKLDTFTENILLNPYNVLLEVFVKTLLIKFQESKVIGNDRLLSTLHGLNPTNMNTFQVKVNTGLLPWLAVHRFVRSLVRQLSLCLSKNSLPDGSLKYKIGRFANKSHSKREVRMKENLSLCLKAFSWISVLEILRAAVVMLKPIRSGTVKAQAKGIIRDIHNAGNTHSIGRSTMPAGMRVHVPSSGANVNQRTIIRNASRMQQTGANSHNPVSSLMLEVPLSGLSSSTSQVTVEDASSDTEDSSRLDETFVITDISGSTLDRNDSDLNEVDWNQSQGITPESSVAWAVDGHIRVRNEVSNRLLPPPGLWQFNPQNHIQQQIMNTPSVHAGYLYLARMFCRLVKEATDLATALRNGNPQDYGPNPGAFSVQPIKFSSSVESALMNDADKLLASSWKWMKNVLNTLENQLKEGENFDTKHFVLRLKKSGQENEIAGLGRPSLTHMYGSSPDEYMMYLLKQDMGEAENCLPVLDLFSFTHMTYILDAYLYMNKSKPFIKKDKEEKEEKLHSTKEVPLANSDEVRKESEHNLDSAEMKFFRDAVDLSSNWNSSKQAEFERHIDEKKLIANQISVWLDETIGKRPRNNTPGTKFFYVNDTKWDHVIDAFTTLFLTEGPGYERDSFLAVKAGSSGRISRFQRSLAAVRGADSPNRSIYNTMASVNPENPALLINVVRSKLLEDCIGVFSEDMGNHPFGCLRVRFEGEEGTGPGVNRGLFAAFANVLKSGKKYKQWPSEFFAECGNLPHQQGIFSPKVGKYDCVDPPSVYFGHPMSQEKRYSAFVAIGRFLGLALWFNYTIPMIFSRPMLLFLLGREEDLVFDDLAFWDSALYSSFSQLIIDAYFSNYTDEVFMDLYDICFEATVDSHTEELVPGGKQTRVTKKNCLSYIRLYTKSLLIQSRENELLGLRDGLTQMIPKDLLENLEPEDLQLLLSGGMEDVGYSRLRSIISFSNSRGCSPEVLERYKTWFWKIVQKMTSSERQKLLYFATGSSVLPALDNRVGNNEELSITVDIINSSNSSALPMSSTCGQRISIPLYSTKVILKNKLLQAIECQSYGLG